MKVGDSFLCQGLNPATYKKVQTAVATTNVRKRPKRFFYQKTEDGTRVWRVA